MCLGFRWGLSRSFYCVGSGGGNMYGFAAMDVGRGGLGAKLGEGVCHVVALDAYVDLTLRICTGRGEIIFI